MSFVDPDNEHVRRSRLGRLIDLSSALRRRIVLGARRVARATDADEVLDGDKGDGASAGLARREVLRDPDRW